MESRSNDPDPAAAPEPWESETPPSDSDFAAEEGLAEASPAGTQAEDPESTPVLHAKLADQQRLADEYLDGWQRSRAEFANYKNRIKREEQEMLTQATASVLARILPLFDDLERALKDRPGQGEAAEWANGLELIYRKWLAILEASGVEPIPTEGQHFDPTVHEALSHEESPEHGEGEVIDVVVKGYRIGDRVLRPALVRVAK